MIIYGRSPEHHRYFDKNGTEITDGCKIKYPNGRIETVYEWMDAAGVVGLGTDATNHRWIETGRAEPCEWGIHPLTLHETNEVEVVKEEESNDCETSCK